MRLKEAIALHMASDTAYTSMPAHGHPESQFYAKPEIDEQKGGLQGYGTSEGVEKSWQTRHANMPFADYKKEFPEGSPNEHRMWIEEELQNGRRVNPEALKDYPDLQRKYGLHRSNREMTDKQREALQKAGYMGKTFNPVHADAEEDAHHVVDKKTADAIMRKHPNWSTDRVAHEMSEAEEGRGPFAKYRAKLAATAAGTQTEPAARPYAVVDGMERELTRWPDKGSANRASSGNAFSRVRKVNDNRETQDKMLTNVLRPQTRDAGVVMGSGKRSGSTDSVSIKNSRRRGGKFSRM